MTRSDSLAEADWVVRELMMVRGYPMGDFERRAADISVDHAAVVDHYRAAHAIAVRDDSDAGATPKTCARPWCITARCSTTCSKSRPTRAEADTPTPV